MAFEATYISTTSTSELASYWPEIAELSTAQQEFVIRESYYKVNEILDSFISTPLPKQPTSGRYPTSVRDAQAYDAIARAITLVYGPDNERSVEARRVASEAIKELVDGKAQIEQMYSLDEVGSQYPVAGSANTSTAIMQVNRQAQYTGSTERIYTFTASSSANIGSAIIAWASGEGDTGSFTSDYEWEGIEDGLQVRFMAAPAGGVSIVSGDTWKIRCVPVTQRPDVPGAYITIIPING